MARFFDAPSDEAYQWGGTGVNYSNEQITVSAWIRVDTLAAGGIIFGISGGAATRLMMQIATGATTKWQCFDEYSTTNKFRRSTAVLSTATWYHLLYTDDVTNDTGSTAIKLYRGGVEESYDATGNGTGPQATNNDAFMVGMNDTGTGNDDFDGDIAEVALWRRLLNIGEIKALATGASPMFIRNALDFYVPMRRNVWDIRGQGAPSGTFGTPDVVPHPPGIYYPAYPSMYQLASAAPPTTIPFIPAIASGANV